MKETNIKAGRPWKTVAKFATYNEADQKRIFLIGEDEKNDTKVKRISDQNNFPFVIKTRLKEEFVAKKKNSKNKKRSKNKEKQK